MEPQQPEPFALQRTQPRQQQKPPEPQQPKNTRQLSMFDAGKSDLPGQRYMFDEFE